MGLGQRGARRHETAGAHKHGVRSEDYWDFAPDQHVMTLDGVGGVVTAVLDGPFPGNETYEVTLDNGLGGGQYTASQLSASGRTTASVDHTAADDYPELGSILSDRPDPALQHYAAKGGDNPFVREAATGPDLNFEHEEQYNGGSKRPDTHTLHGVHPETGDRVGWLTYDVPRRKADKIYVQRMEVAPEHKGNGYAGQLMDEMQRRHPNTPIDHGERTPEGQAWWDSYTRGKTVRRGRTAASVEEDEDVAGPGGDVVEPEDTGDAEDPTGQAAPASCSYCGATDFTDLTDNGRSAQATCAVCGGTMSAAGGTGQWTPELIGDPSNHPKMNADPASGGVGGAASAVDPLVRDQSRMASRYERTSPTGWHYDTSISGRTKVTSPSGETIEHYNHLMGDGIKQHRHPEDMPVPLYHGMNRPLEGEQIEPGRPGNFVRRMKHVYMTEDPNIARNYAGSKGTVYQVKPTDWYGHRSDAKGVDWASEGPLNIVREVPHHEAPGYDSSTGELKHGHLSIFAAAEDDAHVEQQMGLPLLKHGESYEDRRDKLTQHYTFLHNDNGEVDEPYMESRHPLARHHEEHGVPHFDDNDHLSEAPDVKARIAAHLSRHMEINPPKKPPLIGVTLPEHTATMRKGTYADYAPARDGEKFSRVRVNRRLARRPEDKPHVPDGSGVPRPSQGWLAGDDGPSSLLGRSLTHEHGHLRDQELHNALVTDDHDDEGVKRREKMFEEVSQHIPGASPYKSGNSVHHWLLDNHEHIINHVSTYAGEDDKEFVAELYAHHHHSPRPSKAADVVARYLDGEGHHDHRGTDAGEAASHVGQPAAEGVHPGSGAGHDEGRDPTSGSFRGWLARLKTMSAHIPSAPCDVCKGKGTVSWVEEDPDWDGDPDENPGKVHTETCDDCEGRGVMPETSDEEIEAARKAADERAARATAEHVRTKHPADKLVTIDDVRGCGPRCPVGREWDRQRKPFYRNSSLQRVAGILSWDDIGDRHPHIYGDADIHGEAADGADGPGIGAAAHYLAHERPGHLDAEDSSVHDLDFHEEMVHPRHIDYAPSGALDHRVMRAREGYSRHPEQMPPLVLVKRHNVYQVADGHHRAEAAHGLDIPVKAYVAHSPYPDEPFHDGDVAPFHGAEPIEPSEDKRGPWEQHNADVHGEITGPELDTNPSYTKKRHDNVYSGCSFTGSLRVQSEEDYRMQHQAPDANYGAPLHDVEDMMPGFYSHPEHYHFGQEHYWDSASKIQGARGNPEKKIRIYRSLPAEHAGKGFNTGDWVSTSKDYARLHGKHNEDSKHDWPVISTTVPAKHLHTEGDVHEWGYNGPPTSGSVAFKGGYHQEISQRADGSVKPVQRKERSPERQNADKLKEAGYSFSHYRPSEGDPQHTVAAYGPDESWAGMLKAHADGTVHHVEIDPEHAHMPLEEHMRAMVGAPKKEASMTPDETGEMLRLARKDTEFGFHVIASWSDVRDKAKRIRREGGVVIKVATHEGLAGEVQGDHDRYESMITYRPGSRKIADWKCSCKWGDWAWKRTRFYGRQCSHSLALQFEAQSRGMFGKEIHLGMREVVHQRPIQLLASTLVETEDPGDVMKILMAFGLQHSGARQMLNDAFFMTASWDDDEHEHDEDCAEYGCSHEDEEPRQDWDHILDGVHEIHRGVGVLLHPSVHRIVHDESRPVHERANLLLREIAKGDPDSRGRWNAKNLGTHWTTEKNVAENFAEHHNSGEVAAGKNQTKMIHQKNHMWGTEDDGTPEGQPATAVVIHAKPDVSSVDHDPDPMAHGSSEIYDHDAHGEREVPYHPGASVEVKGISWKPVHEYNDHEYTRHDFHEPQFHQAAREHMCPHCGAEVGDDDRTCPRCGERLTPDVPELHEASIEHVKKKRNKTHDTRRHAPQFGYGVPYWGLPTIWCPQCEGGGCGHCGGNGQVVQAPASSPSTTADPVPDQNGFQGPTMSNGISETASLTSREASWLAALEKTAAFGDQRAHESELPPEIHRGIPMRLSDELHGIAHDPARSTAERAQAVLDHYHQWHAMNRDPENLGRHWTTDPKIAQGFATQRMQNDPEAVHPLLGRQDPQHTQVIFHAQTPDANRMIRGDRSMQEHEIFGHDHGEQEVPIRRGTALHINGISFGNGGELTRHDFDGGLRMKAAESKQDGSYYHVAPSTQREQIAEHGIDYTRGNSEYAGQDLPKGNYVFDNRAHARWYRSHRPEDSDIWHVSGEGFERDPLHDPETGAGASSFRTMDPIPPDRISFHSAKQEGPTVSGVALKAADTGRVLMLQRGLDDPKDPAAGTWEFPGGHHEDGDTTSLHAGIREFQEEVGQPFPEGGVVHHTWTSPNGVYQGHVVVIPSESDLSMRDGRVVVNPDDPKGDHHEQAAWWDVEHARKNPALRPEVKEGTPWKEIAKAGGEKTAAAWDSLSSIDPQPGRGTSEPGHSTSQNPASTGFLTAQDPASWDELNTRDPLISDLSVDSMLHEHPEPALPSTDGAAEEDEFVGLHEIPDTHSEISPVDQSMTPNSYHATAETAEEEPSGVSDIIARFQATAAAQGIMAGSSAPAGEGGEVSFDFAAAAREHLAKRSMSKTALAEFDFAEQQELINEGKREGVRARNFGDLQIEGTHYTHLEAALGLDEADSEDLFT